MVNEYPLSHGIVYICEICGYGYRSIGLAEHCELHCDSMQPSAEIRGKAVYRPPVEIVPTITVEETAAQRPFA